MWAFEVLRFVWAFMGSPDVRWLLRWCCSFRFRLIRRRWRTDTRPAGSGRSGWPGHSGRSGLLGRSGRSRRSGCSGRPGCCSSVACLYQSLWIAERQSRHLWSQDLPFSLLILKRRSYICVNACRRATNGAAMIFAYHLMSQGVALDWNLWGTLYPQSCSATARSRFNLLLIMLLS